MLFLVTQRDELCPADQCLSYHADGQSHLNGAAMTVDRREQTSPVPLRTSPAGLETYIAGRTLVSGDGPAWTDLFVQVFSRLKVQQPFLVPAVAEPLIVWVISGQACVEERDLGGEWQANTVRVGDFFLTRSPTP